MPVRAAYSNVFSLVVVALAAVGFGVAEGAHGAILDSARSSAASSPLGAAPSGMRSAKPRPPTLLKARVVGKGTRSALVRVSWRAPQGGPRVIGYRVSLAPTAARPGRAARTPSAVPRTQRSSQDSGSLRIRGTSTALSLSTDESFSVSVQSVTADGAMSSSTTTSVSTDTTAPSTPSGFAVTGASLTWISTAWNASNDNVGVSGYRVWRAGAVVGTTATLAHTFSDLRCATTSKLEVAAFDAAGNVSKRKALSARTTACAAADVQAPTAPLSLSATPTQTSIALAWAASSDDVGVAGYRLSRNGVVVGSATGTAYTFGELSCGTSHTLAVEAYDAAGNFSARSSVTAGTWPCPVVAPANTMLPAISGQIVQGVTLSASAGTWSGSLAAYAYQWRRCASAGALCSDITGAIRTSYEITAADVGATLRVAVTASNAGGSTDAVSAQTALVAAPVCLTGQFRTEFFNNKTLDGVPAFSRCDASVDWDWGTGSPGPAVGADNFSALLVGQFDLATSGTYTFRVTADDGVRLFVDGALVIDRWLDQAATTYTGERQLAAGIHEIRIAYYEAAGAAVLRYGVSLSSPAQAPTNTALPTISGQTIQGATLNASAGTWDGSPTSYAHQWRRCDTAGATCTNISAATSTSYALTAADVGATLRIAVTASNAGGPSSANSAPSTIVQAAPPTGGGSCPVGQFRSEFFNNKTMTGAPALSRCDTTVDWSWGEGSPAVGVAIDNFSARLVGQFDYATSGTYKFSVTADDGVRVYVDGVLVIDKWFAQPPTPYTVERHLTADRHEIRIEYYESAGGATLRYSVVAPMPAAAPNNTAPPFASGMAMVAKTLYATSDTWSGSPTSYAHQWLRCDTAGASCAEIAGATGKSYLQTAADEGRRLRVRVTATNSSGTAHAT